MLSESARMSSAAEARFRVQAPNSTPRAITVIACDAVGETVVRRLAGDQWQRATFLTAASPEAAMTRDGLSDLVGEPKNLTDEVAVADLVVMVAGPGGRAHAVRRIGQACDLRRVTTTGLIVGSGSASTADLSDTLAQLRPWSLMVVLANNDDYIGDMMAALRA
jgi:hypothetical protein